ncbi:serine/threonine-protein kinase-like protein CR4 [Triticum aestivum]|uniref:serine/threonine-protein kinase-like protein CR4 n=1 Tax=Triticum aestivum TaxID=4565 RepID=UPI001D01EABE|nr:serine/threonine-protein kinase-like protein CR4 [Triticum aestivum]
MDRFHTLIPCSAAGRPERRPHPAATSWRHDEAARAGASLPLTSPSKLAPPPVARRLPPVGLLLRGSRLVDPARGRVAGLPDISTPALPPSCTPARDWLACLPCDLLHPQGLLDYCVKAPINRSALLAMQVSNINLTSGINVLLGVSHAIKHLHCHANPPIIHRDIKSANILFDASWVPRLSDFASSVVWDMATQEEGMEVPVIGTFGYIAPECIMHCHLKPASDVYSLGVVMLEVLTGKSAYSQLKDDGTGGPLTDFALPIIEVGNIEELLDRRPVPEPTPWQLQAMKRVAQIAWCCGKLDAKDRPAISDIVASLEMAYELMCRDEAGSVDEPCLWPFVEQIDLPSDSPHSRSSSSAGYHSELAFLQGEVEMNADLTSFALPITEAGSIDELRDRKFHGEDRPAIPDIVASLEIAHEIICRDEPG